MGDPFQPYLSLPTLTAFLRRAGYPVIQRDASLEASDAFLSPARLQASFARVGERLARLESQPAVSADDLARYNALASTHVSAPYVIAHVEQAKAVLRSEAFYDFERYNWSMHTLLRGMALLSAEYYPTQWNLLQFETRYTQGWAWRVADVRKIMQDEAENPFVAFFREQLVPSVQAERPGLVGISITYFTQVIPGLTLARAIKQALPETHVCVGGAVITELAARLACNPDLFCDMDSVITFEGEHALLALAQQLERGGSLAEVPNLMYRDAFGEVVRNALGPVVDVDALPAPDFAGLPLSRYFAPEPVFLLATSRGCYWKRCAFCSVSTAARSKCYRPRAGELVKQDLQALATLHQARNIFLSEDSVAPNRLRLVAEAAQELERPIHWMCETRLEGLTDELCRTIASAGCRWLVFGLESACQRVLNLMDKGTRIEGITAALRHCQSAGIAVNLQTFIGFPGETRAEAWETIQFLLDHRDQVLSVAFGVFMLQQGTLVEQHPARYGVTRIEYPPDDVLAHCYQYEVAEGMSHAEAGQVGRVAIEQIRNAYSYLNGFEGHETGAHLFLYLGRYGADAVRHMRPAEPPAALDAEFARRIPRVPADVARHRLHWNGDGDSALLVFSGRWGRTLKMEPETERLLDLCDGQASVGQIAARLSQPGNGASDVKSYYQALSLVRTCVQNGIVEIADGHD